MHRYTRLIPWPVIKYLVWTYFVAVLDYLPNHRIHLQYHMQRLRLRYDLVQRECHLRKSALKCREKYSQKWALKMRHMPISKVWLTLCSSCGLIRNIFNTVINFFFFFCCSIIRRFYIDYIILFSSIRIKKFWQV